MPGLPPGGGHRGYADVVDGSGLIVACCCPTRWVAGARLFGRCQATTGIAPFGRLVEQVMESEPCASAMRVFWVVDNGSSHRGQASIDRLEGDWPTLRLVHLLVHASWLNQVEIYLSIRQRKVLPPTASPTLTRSSTACLASSAATSRPRSRLPGALPGPTLSGCCTAWPARSGCWQLPDRPASFEWTNPCDTSQGIYHCRYGMAFAAAHPRGPRLAGGPRRRRLRPGRLPHLDLLRQRQGQREAPHSRCLSGRLRRLEIPGRRRVHRLAYYVDGDGTIVLLTVWRRWRGGHHERRRAATALRRRRSPTPAGPKEGSCDESP
jgi:hypothetical protein